MVDKDKGYLLGVGNNSSSTEYLLKDIAYNLRRLVLLQGGGEWKGTKTLVIQPKQYVTVMFVEEMATRLVQVANITTDKTLWLFPDISYASDEQTLKANSFPLAPGLMTTLMLEFKEGIYCYNPYEELAQIKVDIYAMRNCYFSL
jgi:hypothetical protein